jgi:hypothetical protein
MVESLQRARGEAQNGEGHAATYSILASEGRKDYISTQARKEGRVEKAELLANVEKAKERLNSAEKAMQTALEMVAPAARADKAIISNALQTAFAELRKAKDELIALEKRIVR